MGVGQILVIAGGIWIGVWIWLLWDGRRMGRDDLWVVAGCERISTVRIVRSALLVGDGRMI